MTERTAGDPTARMALVPRTLEARGLDATPPMQAQLRKAGDTRAVEILDVILRDEIGHVAVGNHWYRWLCAREGLDPLAHYARWRASPGTHLASALQPRRAPCGGLQRRRDRRAGFMKLRARDGLLTKITALHFPIARAPARATLNQALAP
jgi:hypothetical protein